MIHNKQITMRLPDKLWRKLRDQAAKDDKRLADWLRDAAKEKLARAVL